MKKFRNIGIVIDEENGHVAYLRTDKPEYKACVEAMEWLTKVSIEQNLKSSDIDVRYASYDPAEDKWTMVVSAKNVRFDFGDFHESGND